VRDIDYSEPEDETIHGQGQNINNGNPSMNNATLRRAT